MQRCMPCGALTARPTGGVLQRTLQPTRRGVAAVQRSAPLRGIAAMRRLRSVCSAAPGAGSGGAASSPKPAVQSSLLGDVMAGLSVAFVCVPQAREPGCALCRHCPFAARCAHGSR
jgi:hypothetical protein